MNLHRKYYTPRSSTKQHSSASRPTTYLCGTLEVIIVAAGQAILSWHGAGAPAVTWVINPVDCVVWKINFILAYYTYVSGPA